MIDFGLGVTLRSLEPEHNVQAREWRNDIKIWSWCRQNTLISKLEQEKWYQSLLGNASIKMFSIYDAGENFVGVCGYTSIDSFNRRAEFSLYIAPKYQKKGNAKAALVTLFSHGFLDLGFNCIWGETFADNPAFDMFMKLGMTLEGLRRQFYFKGGKFIDCHIVSILRDEWKI